MRIHTPVALLLCFACSSPGGADSSATTSGSASGSPAVGSPSGTPSTGTPSTGTTTGSTTGLVIDCDNLPNSPVATLLSGARGHHGLVFDTTDHLVGSDTSNMVKVDSAGTASVFVPNNGNFEQLALLPGGDIVAAHIGTQSIQRITPAGATTNLAQNIGAYGVEVGPDDMVYTAAPSGDINRIDPNTGVVEVFVPGNGRSPKVMTWSPDNSIFYFGTLGDRVYRVQLDANFDALDEGVLFVDNVGGWHDGLDADVCGNLYLAD